MAIGSNPLSSTRKCARTEVISWVHKSCDMSGGARRASLSHTRYCFAASMSCPVLARASSTITLIIAMPVLRREAPPQRSAQ
jgi:hypothetical protein